MELLIDIFFIAFSTNVSFAHAARLASCLHITTPFVCSTFTARFSLYTALISYYTIFLTLPHS